MDLNTDTVCVCVCVPTRRGKGAESVEQVKVVTCEGKLTKPGSFVYLGTLTNMDASATPEVRRRMVWRWELADRLGKSGKVRLSRGKPNHACTLQSYCR